MKLCLQTELSCMVSEVTEAEGPVHAECGHLKQAAEFSGSVLKRTAVVCL